MIPQSDSTVFHIGYKMARVSWAIFFVMLMVKLVRPEVYPLSWLGLAFVGPLVLIGAALIVVSVLYLLACTFTLLASTLRHARDTLQRFQKTMDQDT